MPDNDDLNIAVAMVANALISAAGSRKQATVKAAKRIQKQTKPDYKAFWQKVHDLLESGEPIAPHRAHFPNIPNPHAVHYERIGLAEPGGFRLPHHAVHALGKGDPRTAGRVIASMFGTSADDPLTIPPETVRALGGPRVLQRFVQMLRGSKAQSQVVEQPDRHHGRVR
jgi:hypothetical protein